MSARPRIAIVGNCQARPMAKLIPEMFPGVEVVATVVVQLAKDGDADAALASLASADLVLSQLVYDSFPVAFVRTDVLAAHFPGKVVPFLNLFWRGQNPELWARGDAPASTRYPLADYHLTTVREGIAEDLDDAAIIARLADPDWNAERYAGIAQESLAELKRRETRAAVQITDAIESGGRSHRLFLTFNHPTVALMAEHIRRLMAEATGLAPTYHVDALTLGEPLAAIVPPPNPASGLPAFTPRTYRVVTPRSAEWRGGPRPFTEAEVVARFRAAYAQP